MVTIKTPERRFRKYFKTHEIWGKPMKTLEYSCWQNIVKKYEKIVENPVVRYCSLTRVSALKLHI